MRRGEGVSSVGGAESRRRALRAAAAAALILVGLVPGGGGAPSTHILQAEFAGFDDNADGVFEALEVALTLDAPQAGAYVVHATLVWPRGGTTIAEVNSSPRLSQGISRFTVSFAGSAVSAKGLDGPFDLVVELSSSPTGTFSENASFPTPPYEASDFVEAPPAPGPRLRLGAASAVLETPTMNATVSLVAPSVRWAPVGAEASWSEVTLTRVVTVSNFDDTFDSDLLPCDAAFDAAVWGLTALDVGPTAELGNRIRLTISAPVVFAGPGCAAGVDATASISFLVGEHNGTAPAPLDVALQGASQVAVSVELALGAPLPVAAVRLEANLSSNAAGAAFVVPTASGQETLPAAGANVTVAPLAGAFPEEFHTVKVVNTTGAVLETFAWRGLSYQTLSSGQARFAQVSAWRGVSNGTLLLFFEIPAGSTLVSARLDHIAGAVANGVPPPQGTPPRPPPPPPPSALVFAAALAAAAAMFFFSVYARARKY